MTQSKAMLSAFGAFFLWVVLDVAIKLCSQAALSPFMIMAIMGVVGALCITGSALVNKSLSSLRPKSIREQGIICLCAVIIGYVNVIALKHLPLTVFYIAVFTSPLVIAVLSIFLKHETLSLTKIVCLIAGFFGVVLAVSSGGMGNGEWIGYFAVMLSVLSFGAYTVVMQKISKTDSVRSTQLLTSLSLATIGLLGSIQTDTAPAQGMLWLMMGASVINIMGNVLYNRAIQNTSSTNVAQVHYTQIVTGALFGYFIWHEVPTSNLVAGSVIIIVSGMVVAHRAHKAQSVLP